MAAPDRPASWNTVLHPARFKAAGCRAADWSVHGLSESGGHEPGRKALEAGLKIDPNLPEAQVARQMFGEGVK